MVTDYSSRASREHRASWETTRARFDAVRAAVRVDDWPAASQTTTTVRGRVLMLTPPPTAGVTTWSCYMHGFRDAHSSRLTCMHICTPYVASRRLGGRRPAGSIQEI